MMHAYKPSSLGTRDWEDEGWRPIQAKSYQDPYLNQQAGAHL
jgi:hypothetical protein